MCTVPGINLLSPLSLLDRRNWCHTRGKWLLARNPDRNWWHRHKNFCRSPWLHRQQLFPGDAATTFPKRLCLFWQHFVLYPYIKSDIFDSLIAFNLMCYDILLQFKKNRILISPLKYLSISVPWSYSLRRAVWTTIKGLRSWFDSREKFLLMYRIGANPAS